MPSWITDNCRQTLQINCDKPQTNLHKMLDFFRSLWYYNHCLFKQYLGEFPSGQRGQTVNLLALPSVVRIHLRPVKYLLTNET